VVPISGDHTPAIDGLESPADIVAGQQGVVEAIGVIGFTVIDVARVFGEVRRGRVPRQGKRGDRALQAALITAFPGAA